MAQTRNERIDRHKDRVAVAMDRLRDCVEHSNLSLTDIGRAMGYASSKHAYQAADKFINRTKLPRLDMLLRACAALEIDLDDLLHEDEVRRHQVSVCISILPEGLSVGRGDPISWELLDNLRREGLD